MSSDDPHEDLPDEDEADAQSLSLDQIREEIDLWASDFKTVLRKVTADIITTSGDTLDRTHARLTSNTAKWIYVGIAINATLVGVGYLSWTMAGPLATFVYLFLFLLAMTMIPGIIYMFGAGIPGSGMLGTLNGILGAFAFGRHVLVQTDERYRWCPARKDAIYLDGEWVDIDDGLEHWSVLWWRPFAIARLKSDQTLVESRVDTRAERLTGRAGQTDGGTTERGGTETVAPAIESGDDGTWVLDLKRLFTPGLLKMGDIELIETTEEITMREESESQSQAWWQPMVYVVVGLLIGLPTGYVFIFA